MKEYLLIILLVLATVICSVLCRQIIRSNEQIRQQIAELKTEIEQAKKPKVTARKPQQTQNQADETASTAHSANAELRREKRILEKQVAEQKQVGNELDKVITSPSFRSDKRRKVTLAELEKLDPTAYAHHLESIQAEQRRQREKMEQRLNFIATMDTSLLPAEETERLKEYLQLLNQAYEMRLNGEEIPKDMFTGYFDIPYLVTKYSLAAIGSHNTTLPAAKMLLQTWSQTPHYTVLNPITPIPTSKGVTP